MKTIRFAMVLALSATSMTPAIVATPAFAAPASPLTEGAMAGICATNLGAVVNTGEFLSDGTPVWSTLVVDVAESEGAPVEVSRLEIPGTRFGTGSATYSGLAIAGEPFRTGGSVNMFGDQVATHKHWANSTYQFTGIYETTTTYTFGCAVAQETEYWTDPVYGPSYPDGEYINNGTNPSGNEGSCQGLKPGHPNWGTTFGNCTWVGNGGTITGELIAPGYWTRNPTTLRPDLASAGSTSQVDTSQADGVETNGGPWTQVAGPGDLWLAGKAVVCISPKRVPGVWQNHNGYTGSNCNTAYFNTAPWGGGSQDSNGTYISVPGV